MEHWGRQVVRLPSFKEDPLSEANLCSDLRECGQLGPRVLLRGFREQKALSGHGSRTPLWPPSHRPSEQPAAASAASTLAGSGRTGLTRGPCTVCNHALVELTIRDLKEGAGIEHIPSGDFDANSAWLCCAVLAHNLIRWTATIGQFAPVDQLRVARTIRMRLIDIPGRLVNHSDGLTLRGPTHWPWAQLFTRRLAAIRALPAPG